MLLLLQHPEVAYRSCEDCYDHLYNKQTGQRELDKRTGQPIRRPSHIPPPCRLSEGCPKGCFRVPKKPDEDRSLTHYNRRAYQHYLECKATGDWPRYADGSVEETVKRNAAIIARAEQLAQWAEQKRQTANIQGVQETLMAFLRAMAASSAR